ncbi:MAG: adenylate/guanylate cyclase domain-containing protein [Dehalococcoidia bacterium]
MGPGGFSHLVYARESPEFAHVYQRLSSFTRLIRFDKRGTGMSDRTAGIAGLEERMDDIRAVMDAAGAERAAIYGISESGPMCLLFAATYPERVQALILYGSGVKWPFAPNSSWGQHPPNEAQVAAWEEHTRRYWGTEQGLDYALRLAAPSRVDDETFRRFWGSYLRLSGSPGAAVALARMNREIDVRAVLPAIRVPTIILHRADDRSISVEEGRYLAAEIPGAKSVELPGCDHLDSTGDADAILDEVEEFLTGMRHAPEPDRVLATLLFTDIVGSTERVVALGDHRWRELKEQHYTLVRRELARYRGQEVDTAGDGFFATFDGPARAVRCAVAVRDAVRSLGLEIRAGVHTGEVELHDRGVSGLAVHLAARVAALAGPAEVLVSSTVKDLVAGSGLRFEDLGSHQLKGVPEEWRLFTVL